MDDAQALYYTLLSYGVTKHASIVVDSYEEESTAYEPSIWEAIAAWMK